MPFKGGKASSTTVSATSRPATQRQQASGATAARFQRNARRTVNRYARGQR